MYTFSTATFVSVLALASSLAVVVQAGDPRAQCKQTRPVPKTLTCEQLFAMLGGDRTAILLMNPGRTCGSMISSGSVCTFAKFPTCKTKVTAGPMDTNCDRLAAANGINNAQFIDFNNDVNANDCSGVVPGQKYCVAVNDDN